MKVALVFKGLYQKDDSPDFIGVTSPSKVERFIVNHLTKDIKEGGVPKKDFDREFNLDLNLYSVRFANVDEPAKRTWPRKRKKSSKK